MLPYGSACPIGTDNPMLVPHRHLLSRSCLPAGICARVHIVAVGEGRSDSKAWWYIEQGIRGIQIGQSRPGFLELKDTLPLI